VLEHLTDILVGTGIAVLSASIFGVWRISSRTRSLEAQHEVLRRDVGKVEEEVTTLLPILGHLQLLNERCQTRCTTDRENRDRNDEAHELIMVNLAKTDARIEVSREERVHQIESLKADLIREFRKNGGR